MQSFCTDYEWIQNTPELMALFSRTEILDSEYKPEELLERYGFPERTKISELQFETWKAEINPKFCKDGYMYLLRGDFPNLDKKGIYARIYGYCRKNTKQCAEQIESPNEVGFLLYDDERYLRIEPHSKSVAEELAYLQSAVGGSSFVSTTTNIPCAKAGTGNQPTDEEKSTYEIYVLKVPTDYVINRNGNGQFGLNEEEYLIPDFVAREEIIAKFPRNETENVYNYIHNLLGVTREDVGLTEE